MENDKCNNQANYQWKETSVTVKHKRNQGRFGEGVRILTLSCQPQTLIDTSKHYTGLPI